MRNGQYAAAVVAIPQNMQWHISGSGPAFSVSAVHGPGHCSHRLLRSHHAMTLASLALAETVQEPARMIAAHSDRLTVPEVQGLGMHHRGRRRRHWGLRLQRHDGDDRGRICWR